MRVMVLMNSTDPNVIDEASDNHGTFLVRPLLEFSKEDMYNDLRLLPEILYHHVQFQFGLLGLLLDLLVLDMVEGPTNLLFLPEIHIHDSSEDGEANKSLPKDNNIEITGSMHLEMEYNSDRAWYDREEGNTMFDVDSTSFFLGDDTSFQKKEAELAKKLILECG